MYLYDLYNIHHQIYIALHWLEKIKNKMNSKYLNCSKLTNVDMVIVYMGLFKFHRYDDFNVKKLSQRIT